MTHSSAVKRYTWRQHERAKGKTFPIDLIPAETSQKALMTTRRKQMSWVEISRLTGMPPRTLQEIGNRNVKRVQRQTEQKILRGLAEHDLRSIAPNSLVPVKRLHRQIVKSLIAQGWTAQHQQDIIRQNGRGTGAVVHHMINPARMTSKAQKKNLDQLIWLAEVIGDKRGPTKSATRMERKGVFPLKHYDKKGRLNVNSLSPEQRRYVQ